MSLFSEDLNIVAGDSFQAILTCFASDLAQVDISAATSATLQVYITPEDPAPLVSITTTSGPSGQLVFGIAPPAPVGLFVVSQRELAGIGTAQFTELGMQATLVSTVANIGALEVLPTDSFVLSNAALVTGVGYYQWSPGDTRTPDGTTIVAGDSASGNWLLYGTVTVNITPSASALLAGQDRARSVLTVTWADATTTAFFSGTMFIGQPAP